MSTEIQKQENTSVKSVEKTHYSRPYYEVDTREGEYEVRVYMPGVTRSSTEISLKEDNLIVTGERVLKSPESWRVIRQELPGHNYRLQLRLNVDIDENKIAAKVEDGLLIMNLPVAEAAKPRTIAID